MKQGLKNFDDKDMFMLSRESRNIPNVLENEVIS